MKVGRAATGAAGGAGAGARTAAAPAGGEAGRGAGVCVLGHTPGGRGPGAAAASLPRRGGRGGARRRNRAGDARTGGRGMARLRAPSPAGRGPGAGATARAAGTQSPPAAELGGEKSPWPFCSERCRLIDLARWLGEEYRVPGTPDIEALDAGATAIEEDEKH